jgi:hypothetical protein
VCYNYRRANDNNTVLFATPAGRADNDDNNGASDAGSKANQV